MGYLQVQYRQQRSPTLSVRLKDSFCFVSGGPGNHHLIDLCTSSAGSFASIRITDITFNGYLAFTWTEIIEILTKVILKRPTKYVEIEKDFKMQEKLAFYSEINAFVINTDESNDRQ